MKSIFREIVGDDLVVKGIKRIRDKSVAADRGQSNKMLGWVGMGRNTDLSQAKREIADKYWPKITALADQTDDSETYKEINALLIKCKDKAAKKSKEFHYSDEGKFGPRMQKLIDLTRALFKILEEHNLLDISHDDDPLNSFRFYAALYLIQKEVDTRKLNAIGKLLQNPMITNIKRLAEDKEKLLLEVLEECEADLAGLDKGLELYPENKKRFVLAAITKLKRENINLCKKYGVQYNLPLTLNFFASLNLSLPTLRPDEGFLEDCADRALNEIKEGKAPTTGESSLILVKKGDTKKGTQKGGKEVSTTTSSRLFSREKKDKERLAKEKNLKDHKQQERKNKKLSKKEKEIVEKEVTRDVDEESESETETLTLS